MNQFNALSNPVQYRGFVVSEAVEAICGDVQLARRMVDHHLPNWTDDKEFMRLATDVSHK